MNWQRYIVTGINAFVSAAAGSLASFGGATAVGVGTAKALQIAGITALLSGAVSFFKWLQQHPLPGAEQ